MGGIGNSAPNLSKCGNLSFDVNQRWFTARPDARFARQMGVVWRQYWQGCAKAAISSAAESLSICLDELISRVDGIDPTLQLSPRLFVRLAKLMDRMGKQDVSGVMDTIQSWIIDPPNSWHAAQMSIESVANHEWETLLLDEIRATRISGSSPLECYPLLFRDLGPYQAALKDALRLIKSVDRGMSSEILEHVSVVKLFQGRGIEGLSSPKAFGSVWINIPDEKQALVWFLEHMVHECSHLNLNILMAFDPLMENPYEVHQAPIRPDPRPLFQVLHGTYVLSRNCRIHARLHREFPHLNLDAKLQLFRNQLQAGLDVICKHMKPTPAGKRLLQSLLNEAKDYGDK